MSVYKRPGSKYYWTKFELNGKRIHKSTKTTNLNKALQWEAALRTQMQRVLVGLERDPTKNTTLREFRQRFLDEIRSLHTDRHETQDFYERRYDELLAYDGFECPLSEIDEESIDAFRTWKQTQISRFGRTCFRRICIDFLTRIVQPGLLVLADQERRPDHNNNPTAAELKLILLSFRCH